MENAEGEFQFTWEGMHEQRLDKVICFYLSGILPDQRWTRSQIKQWIEAGRVSVDGRREEKAGAGTKPGAVVCFTMPSAVADLEPYEFNLEVVYEDSHLIVLNKPAGISMHPGAGNPDRTLANALVAHFLANGEGGLTGGIRPGIVHRLDKETTGLVVAAKKVEAHASLSAQFASREAGRRYTALVLSTPRAKRPVDMAAEGTIEGNIGRHPAERKMFSVVEGSGKKAVTHWTALERMGHASLLEVRIATGRTHQIRVHMAHVGSPVIGDPVYGEFSSLPAVLRQAAQSFGRQALHASRLEFTHPGSGERMTFSADVPGDMAALVEKFRKVM